MEYFFSVIDLTCFHLNNSCHTDGSLFEPLAVLFVWTNRNAQPDCCIHRMFKQSRTLSASPSCLCLDINTLRTHTLEGFDPVKPPDVSEEVKPPQRKKKKKKTNRLLGSFCFSVLLIFSQVMHALHDV